jgi:hypothetical protein
MEDFLFGTHQHHEYIDSPPSAEFNLWTVTAQVTGAPTFTVGATDRVWFNGVGGAFGTNVVVGSYQDGTHISSNADAHVAACTTGGHLHNTKFLTSTTMSLDGAGSANLSTLTTGSAPLKFVFDTSDLGGASVVTNSAKFYAYSTSDGTPVSGVTVQAGEAAVTSTWVSIGTTGGSAAGLSIADQTTATSHNFFLAVSVTPTSTGAKTTNVFKLSLTYV